MLATTAVIRIENVTLLKMMSFYKEQQQANPSPYIIFFAKGEDFSLSIYSKEEKGLKKAVFQGPKAEEEASIWGTPALSTLKKEEAAPLKETKVFNAYPQIGSDEVGTGDFFGPICVCAGYVSKELLPRLEELGVTDSKMLDDSYIRKIGPILLKEFPYSQLALQQPHYNEVNEQGINMNAIKARMHNRCLLNLKKRYPESALYMDQFAQRNLYYSYLKDGEEVADKIFFATKGETKFPSVALGSVIARYSFLLKMEALDKKYGVHFPFGAGANVDEFLKEFLLTHDKKELVNCAKLNFINYKRLLDTSKDI